MRVPPSLPNHFPKILPPNIITLFVRISTYAFGACTHSTITLCSPFCLPFPDNTDRWEKQYFDFYRMQQIWKQMLINNTFPLTQNKTLRFEASVGHHWKKLHFSLLRLSPIPISADFPEYNEDHGKFPQAGVLKLTCVSLY